MFRLDRLPQRKKDIFAWADYVELCCLHESDLSITVAEISDHIEEGEEFNQDSDIYVVEGHTADLDDLRESYVTQYMSYFQSRLDLFQDAYPFNISQNKIELKNDLTSKQTGYLVLLLSSCLRNIEECYWEVLTTSFEYITEEYFSKLLSDNGCVYIISSKNQTIGSTAYQRIKWMANQLGTSIRCSEERFLRFHQKSGKKY